MTFDDLLDETFALATGKTRASARRTKRFKQLYDEAPHVPYTSNDEVAEMLLLGELIADRAFANLPLQIRKMAKVWHYVGHEGQVDILNTLFRVLGDESLKQRESAYERGFSLNESLPHQYGKWGKGDLIPNCLGMSQMLIGFARATGAPHMMIDTLRRHDMYTNEYRYLRFRELLTIIEPYKNDRWINALSKYGIRDGNETLSLIVDHGQEPQSHALLSIRTDEEWWIIDPYMKICCKDTYHQGKLDRLYRSKIVKHPQLAATIHSNEKKTESIVEYHLSALREYIPYLDKLDQPRSQWSFNQQGLELITYSLMGYNLSKDERMRKDLEIRTIDLSMRSVYPRHVFLKMLDDQSDPLKLNDNYLGDLLQRVRDLDRTKRKRNQGYRRLVKGVIASAYNRILDVDVAVDAPPILREYMHPIMQLAVKTIDQIATDRQIDTPQLIKFGSHQWLIYNMLGSVERSGSKRFQQILTRKARRFKGYAHLALPQLQPHLPQLIGENHGKQQ